MEQLQLERLQGSIDSANRCITYITDTLKIINERIDMVNDRIDMVKERLEILERGNNAD